MELEPAEAQPPAEVRREAVSPPIKTSAHGPTEQNLTPAQIPIPNFQALPLDVPVLGIGVGGVDADFQFNGTVIDYARRPIGISNAVGVYALFLSGDSMYPKYEDGNIIYVNPNRPPKVGDCVVVELYGNGEGAPGKGFIKRLKRRTMTKIVVEQFNPPKEMEFDLKTVKAIHRIIPWEELLGI